MVRFSLPLALSNSSIIHSLSSSMSHLMTVYATSVLTMIGRPERYSSHVLAETFLPTVLLYSIVRHYFQGLPLIHCDIPSHFSLGERLFWCKHAAQTGYLYLAWHSPTDWFHSPCCTTTNYHKAICCSAYTLCLRNFHSTHIHFCGLFTYLQEKK